LDFLKRKNDHFAMDWMYYYFSGCWLSCNL